MEIRVYLQVLMYLRAALFRNVLSNLFPIGNSYQIKCTFQINDLNVLVKD